MKDRHISSAFQVVFETPSPDCSEWFGYYNYDTLSRDHSKLLCGRRYNRALLSADNVESIEIGYYDISSGEWHHIDITDSWSGAQGAMLQWLNSGKDDCVIYNTSKGGHIISRIFNIKTGEKRDLDWGIYDLLPDGKHSIALDFERSYWCRAYHYQSVANPLKDGNIIDGDGIYDIDIDKNTRKLIVDIKTIISCDPEPGFENMKHWVEHIMVSRNGKKFCFLHRFSPVDDIYKYQTRLFIANIDGTGLQLVPNWKKFEWSHFGWQVDDGFVIYSSRKINIAPASQKQTISTIPSSTKQSRQFNVIPFVKKIIKTILPSSIQNIVRNNGYQFYQINNGSIVLRQTLNNAIFNIDGHPSFTSDGKYMITDSYADNDDYRRLIIYNTETKKGKIFAQLPDNLTAHRCDLHPKLSRDNQFVVLDNTSLGRQSMMVLRIDWKYVKKSIG